MNMNLYDRIKYFDAPFAYIVVNYQVEKFCSYCLRVPHNKLLLCGQCRFARYCDKTCQRLAWHVHKPECARLKISFPNLPVSEVLFLARVIDRLKFLKEKGDVYNWQKDRKFEDLITHEKEIRADPEKMKHFEKIADKYVKYVGPANLPDSQEFFLAFCRSWINSHSIHTNAGTEIGMALDLGVSRYDHCCRPNLTLVFDGFRAMLRPLTPETNADDFEKSFISYVDVGRSKYQRRKELWSKWYFWCQCERCTDPDEDRLTSIKCSNSNCLEAIIITEDCEPVEQTCKSCHSLIGKQQIVDAQDFMKSIPSKFSFNFGEEETRQVEGLLKTAETMLHSENIYYCRLQTACMQMKGDQGMMIQPDALKLVYQNYRRCLPKADRHIGYQLLHLVKALIEQGRRDEAVQYAFEAMVIFEVCFGLQHPYYLQTLGLWTFLDTKADKTDGELKALMNFNYNRPVDITPFLEKADKLEAKRS